jgi:hypothetical protein
VPLLSSLDEMSVDQLRDVAFRAVKVTSLLEKRCISASTKSLIFHYDQSRELETSEEELGEVIQWSWLLGDGIHLVSMLDKGRMVIWNIIERRRVRSILIGGQMHCWDHRADSDGITIIANVEIEFE